MARLSESNWSNCFPSRFIAMSEGASCGDSETALCSLTISNGGTTMLVTTVSANQNRMMGTVHTRMARANPVGAEWPPLTLSSPSRTLAHHAHRRLDPHVRRR